MEILTTNLLLLYGFSTRRKTCLDIGGCDLAFLTRNLPGIILEPVSIGLYGQALGKIDDLSIREKEILD